jgi:hypothetical protein
MKNPFSVLTAIARGLSTITFALDNIAEKLVKRELSTKTIGYVQVRFDAESVIWQPPNEVLDQGELGALTGCAVAQCETVKKSPLVRRKRVLGKRIVVPFGASFDLTFDNFWGWSAQRLEVTLVDCPETMVISHVAIGADCLCYEGDFRSIVVDSDLCKKFAVGTRMRVIVRNCMLGE